MSVKATTPQFTTFLLFPGCSSECGKKVRKKDRNQIEWPPTTTYRSFTDVEKMKSQKSRMRFNPLVFTGLFPAWRLISIWFIKVDWKSVIFDPLSIQEAWMGVCGGVIDRVSGFRLISWREGKISTFSWGRRLRRSLKPPATVVTARLRLEDTNFDAGASGLAINMQTCWHILSLSSNLFVRNFESASTWFNPRVEVGES